MGPDCHGKQKTTQNFPTKETKKNKKKFKPFLDTQKNFKKGFSNTVSQKKFITKVAKKIKKIQKRGSQTKP